VYMAMYIDSNHASCEVENAFALVTGQSEQFTDLQRCLNKNQHAWTVWQSKPTLSDSANQNAALSSKQYNTAGMWG